MTSLTAGTGIKILHRQEHEIIDACQLTETERAEFGYLDWPAIDDGRDSASFFRRDGELYDLGSFMRTSPGSTEYRLGWHGFAADSFFSGIAVHISDDGETILSALLLSD
jgi:hypothetical protein